MLKLGLHFCCVGVTVVSCSKMFPELCFYMLKEKMNMKAIARE